MDLPLDSASLVLTVERESVRRAASSEHVGRENMPSASLRSVTASPGRSPKKSLSPRRKDAKGKISFFPPWRLCVLARAFFLWLFGRICGCLDGGSAPKPPGFIAFVPSPEPTCAVDSQSAIHDHLSAVSGLGINAINPGVWGGAPVSFWRAIAHEFCGRALPFGSSRGFVGMPPGRISQTRKQSPTLLAEPRSAYNGSRVAILGAFCQTPVATDGSLR